MEVDPRRVRTFKTPAARHKKVAALVATLAKGQPIVPARRVLIGGQVHGS